MGENLPDKSNPHGWLGDYEGFAVTATEQVSIHGHDEVMLSSKDVALRPFIVLPSAFVAVVPQKLDQARFLEAAKLVLHSYPALGSRLRLEPVPASLDLSRPSFPVTFATWPRGRREKIAYDYQWQGYSDTDLLMPDPPFADGIQVEEAVKGKAPLFTLQATSLGDETTIVAAACLHVLLDGQRVVNVMNALAAAYRGLDGSSGNVVSKYLPSPKIQRPTWAWNLLDLPMNGVTPPADGTPKSAEDEAQVMHSQDGLTEGPVCVTNPSEYRRLFGILVAQEGEWLGGWSAYSTFQLQKADMQKLKKEMQSYPSLQGVVFSTNDVVLAVSWMLRCAAQDLPRPGQGPRGTTRRAGVILNASVSWPELSPPGYMGNLSLFPSAAVESDGTAEAEQDTVASLKSALAQIIKAVRTTIKQAREPAILRETMCTLFEGILNSEAGLAMQEAMKLEGSDGPLTTWYQFGHEDMDFGNGPPDIFLGHFGVLVSHIVTIMALGEGAYGVRIPVHSKEGMQRLKSSPVLPALAPSSCMLEVV